MTQHKTPPTMRERFLGCVMGLAIGDALGAPYEGLPADMIRKIGPASRLVENPEDKTLFYTDDTEMTVGVLETLIEYGRIKPDYLAKRFAENFHPERGYGQGAHEQIVMIQDGRDYSECLFAAFKDGSYGNGAAMRVAPVGLLFCNDLPTLLEQAELSARVTHAHELGVEGAKLIALSVAAVVQMERFDRDAFFDFLEPHCRTEEFAWQIRTLRRLERFAPTSFGNSLEAHRSVVTAIQIFIDNRESYTETIRTAMGMGNDVDTLCAMAGAISGAYLGIGGIPSKHIDRLENGHNGRDTVIALAERLYGFWEERNS